MTESPNESPYFSSADRSDKRRVAIETDTMMAAATLCRTATDL